MKIVSKCPRWEVIPTEQLVNAQDHDRSAATLRALVRDISDHGLTSLPIVQKLFDGQYIVIRGDEEVAAIKTLGWRLIPVFVLDDNHPLAKGAKS